MEILGNARISNTIHWGNEQPFYAWTDKEIDIIHCNIMGGIENNFIQSTGIIHNNIEQNPQFINPSSGSGLAYPGYEANWSPDNFSACVDGGTIDIPGIPSLDIYGNPRFNNHIPDIGAVEHELASPAPFAPNGP